METSVFLAWYYTDSEKCLECGKEGDWRLLGVFASYDGAVAWLASEYSLGQEERKKLEACGWFAIARGYYDDYERRYDRITIEKHSVCKL